MREVGSEAYSLYTCHFDLRPRGIGEPGGSGCVGDGR